MDLNHFELPAGLVASLYRRSLVDTGENTTATDIRIPATGTAETVLPLTGQKWVSLGNNQKNILIIVQHDPLIPLPDEDLQFLTDILSACKLGMDDVALINLSGYSAISYKEIIKHFKSRTVFLFGTEPSAFGLPMSFPHFQVQSFTGISFLYSPPLGDFSNDKVLKSKLWVCLKRIFGI